MPPARSVWSRWIFSFSYSIAALSQFSLSRYITTPLWSYRTFVSNSVLTTKKVFFICFHLQNRCVVVSEMIICSLPQISMRFGNHFDFVFCDCVLFWSPCPLHIFCVDFHFKHLCKVHFDMLLIANFFNNVFN